MKLKTSYTCSAWLTRMSELSRFVYIMSRDTTCEIQRPKSELYIECVQRNLHGISRWFTNSVAFSKVNY